MKKLLILATALLLTACQIPPEVAQYIPQPAVTTPVEEFPTQFNWGDPAPALQAWRVITRERGWNESDILAWQPFVEKVMARESGFCPNVRRGARIDILEGCIIAKQGTHSDSGFGQVLMGYPGKRGWYRPENGGKWGLHENASFLCPEEGICTPEEVVSDPRKSMTVLVALIERSGRQPWCYTARLRNGAVCRSAP